MVDRFLERVANLAGRTSRALDKVASELEKDGYITQPGMLRAIAKSNSALAHDCATTTQPIEVERYNLTNRIKKLKEEADEVAADLLSRGKQGHNELSEISVLAQRALELQDK